MLSSLSLPRPPLRLVVAVVGIWVALLIAAALLKATENVWLGVVADLLGTVAGVAFAVTGLAALLSRPLVRWQHRRHLMDLAPLTASQFNTGADDVNRLTLTLFEMLAGAVPAVRIGLPSWLANLVSVPFDEEAAKISVRIIDCADRIQTARSMSEWTVPVARTRGFLDMTSEGQGGENELLRRQAWMVVPDLCFDQEPAASAVWLSDQVDRCWADVVKQVERAVAVSEAPGLLSLPGARELVVSLGLLRATLAEAGADGPRFSATGNAYGADRARNLLLKLLSGSVEVARNLTKVRAEFCEFTSEVHPVTLAVTTVRLHDTPELAVRETSQNVASICLLSAWQELEQRVQAGDPAP